MVWYGEVGINKHNNYTPNMYDPRRVCVKCVSVNHLYVHYKLCSPKNQYSAYLPNLVTPHIPPPYVQMPYIFNPYFSYGNFPIPWSMG